MIISHNKRMTILSIVLFVGSVVSSEILQCYGTPHREIRNGWDRTEHITRLTTTSAATVLANTCALMVIYPIQQILEESSMEKNNYKTP